MIEISPPTFNSMKPPRSVKTSPFEEKTKRGITQFVRPKRVSPKTLQELKTNADSGVKKNQVEVLRNTVPRRSIMTPSVAKSSHSAEKLPMKPSKFFEPTPGKTEEGGKTFFVDIEEPLEAQRIKALEPRLQSLVGKRTVPRKSLGPEKKLAPVTNT
jgi:hypothetical protein